MAKFQVSVMGVSQEKAVLFLKSLRVITNLNLKEAKDLAAFIAATMPCVLVTGIDRDVADDVVSWLQDAGATAGVEESSLTVPLLLCPPANRRYRWSWLGRTAIE